MEILKGYVDRITYRNEDNGYTVFHMECDEYDDMTCVGNVPVINEGDFLEVQGEYIDHPTYGIQMKVSSVVPKEPDDIISIERYLASGAIKGIGAKLAASIVKEFGEDAFRVIEEEPELLARIKGISMKKAMDIAVQMEEKRDMRQAMLFLQQYGISNHLSARIYEFYGPGLYAIIRENPYRMAEDIDGVGFKIADEIAARIGILVDSEFRIASGLQYVLQQAAMEGHIYLPESVLLRRAEELLGVESAQIEKFVLDLALERKVVIKAPEGLENAPESEEEDRLIYTSSYYHLEYDTARMLHELNVTETIDEEKLLRQIKKLEEHDKIELDDQQRIAVREAMRNGVLIITGGPGTGKTTTINTLIGLLERDGQEICLAAPTGRAAQRMSEATGRKAQTIHRLLEVGGIPGDTGGRGMQFQKNEENPLEYDTVIIDEMSMVDIHLMHALLRAIVPGTHLILVGDVNQLPSVGPGSVLKDIIGSHCFNMVMLTRIFRQAAQSDIILNAHRINRGEPADLSNDSRDFFFLRRDDPNLIISNIIQLVHEKMPKYVHAPESEIQVLTPMRKGPLGVERLNRILQEYLNPPSPDKEEKTVGDTIFRCGDKVMQIKNDYQLEWEIRGLHGIAVSHGTGVYNGDTGVITGIDLYDETLTVRYDDARQVVYPFSGLDELELAYAMTIHKSQGSEYPAVVIPLLSGPPMLFNRNLLYTAVTRARKCVTLLGSEETIGNMIRNTHEQKRYTSLDRWIRELAD